MKKDKFIIFSLIGAVICSALCVGYATKQNSVTTINSQENIDITSSSINDTSDPDYYWENTPIEEIRESILGYIDDMMNSTTIKLDGFIRENNESKIKLYEGEIKRLNKILKNVNTAKTKEDLREAMQVRHKDSI